MTEEYNINEVFRDSDGSGIFAVSFGDSEMADSIESKLSTNITEPENTGARFTPKSSDDDYHLSDEVGPIVRASESMTFLGSNGLEAISINNYEISKAINRLTDETFRSDFPMLRPTVDDPSDEQEERVESILRQVNEAGQSFHGLLKMVLADHARIGVGMIVIRREYAVYEDEIISARTEELVRGDPKRIRPVTDEYNNPGGLYACRIHRTEVTTEEEVCDVCGCEMDEVTYARTEGPRSDTIEDVFFDDEIVDFAFYNTRLQGRDGLPPTAGVWKQGYILDQMRNYTGKYFDDSTGNRYPDKLLFVKTSDADAFSKQARQAKDNRQESPYEEGILFQEGGELDVQVVDMMSSEIMGQSKAIKEEYKSDIRTAYGLTDIVDSDEDSSAMASGTKAVDVMSRSIQALQTDLEREVLPKIEDTLGLSDWELSFKEEQTESAEMTMLEKAEAVQRLSKAGVDFRVEGGELSLVDTDEDLSGEQTEESDDNDDDGTDVSI